MSVVRAPLLLFVSSYHTASLLMPVAVVAIQAYLHIHDARIQHQSCALTLRTNRPRGRACNVNVSQAVPGSTPQAHSPGTPGCGTCAQHNHNTYTARMTACQSVTGVISTGVRDHTSML